MRLTRRESLSVLGGAVAASALHPILAAAEEGGRPVPHIATNTYPWSTFARRAGKTYSQSESLWAEIAKTGIAGYEPIVNNPKELDGLGPRLKKHGLEMRSLYVNSTLHDTLKPESPPSNSISEPSRSETTPATLSSP